MTEPTPSPLNNVITIDDERIKNHLDRVVRGSVEENVERPAGGRGGPAVQCAALRVTLAGTTRRVDMCQPAWSARRTAWAAGSAGAAISARCRFIASVLQAGRIRAAPLPCFGQTAPKM